MLRRRMAAVVLAALTAVLLTMSGIAAGAEEQALVRVAHFAPGLLKDWPQGGPPLAWKINGIGEGFSTVAVMRRARIVTSVACSPASSISFTSSGRVRGSMS